MKFIILMFALLLSAQVFGEEYIVKFRSSNLNKGLKDLSEIQGITALKSTIPQLNMAVVYGDKIDLNLAQKLNTDVEYIVPNGKIKLVANPPTDKELNKETDFTWGLRAANVVPAWKITRGSKDVIVAVSDTGTWFNHFDLDANVWRNPGESGKDANDKDKSKNKIDDDNNGFVDDINGFNFETYNNYPNDDHYHGTHVAGTIGAVGGNKSGVAGVNWFTSIMTTKFIGAGGEGEDDGAISGILYAVDNGAKVINASWGSDEPNQALYDAIAYAQRRGVIFVAAAGNDSKNADAKPMYPAAYDLDNIISVAALDDAKGTIASWSNYGKKSVDLAAPGRSIYSTFNPMQSMLRRDWFYHLDGTSMAAPHVTGTVALMYAANPDLKWTEVKEIILGTAKKVSKLENKLLSGGMLDIGAAVQKAHALKQEAKN